jgi:hypothetical protein
MRNKGLNEEQVKAIRASTDSSRNLAREHKVSYVTILNARHGKGAYAPPVTPSNNVVDLFKTEGGGDCPF